MKNGRNGKMTLAISRVDGVFLSLEIKLSCCGTLFAAQDFLQKSRIFTLLPEDQLNPFQRQGELFVGRDSC